MEKDIRALEEAVLNLARAVESGTWQGILEETHKILGYKPVAPLIENQ